MQRLAWDLVNDGVLVIHDLTPPDLPRMQVLIERYHDTPMDLADASLVVAAETLGLTRVFTVDSDFYVYRFSRTGVFEVIP